MTNASELVLSLLPVVEQLNRLGVRYCIGGSVASSVHGASRSTLDVDLGAELDEAAALRLVAALQNEFYVSKQAFVEAVRRRSCFNLIHLAIILLKLEWYRLGNDTSQRQWSDLTTVAKLQADRLDHGYLRHWAKELGVADLAERLLSEVRAQGRNGAFPSL
jgi:hypothetical protein